MRGRFAVRLALIGLLAAGAVAGCSNDDNGSTGPQTGVLSIRITDAPAQFDQVNLVVTQVRREQRWKRILPLLTAAQPQSAPPSDRPLLTDEIKRKVAEALEQLPIKFRAPLVLFEIEEWSYDAIARALGCRIGTIKSRISRARKLMRVQLESWWIGGNDDGRRSWQGPAATTASSGVATLQV